jgi:DNA processing protein
MTRRQAYLALNLIPRIGPVRVRKLLEVFNTPEAVLAASEAEIRRVSGFGAELAKHLHGWEQHIDLSREERRIQELGVSYLIPEDDVYPATLREIYDPPLVLYVWGKIEVRDRIAIGVVGSRRATHYGMQCSKKMSYQLAGAGVTILSGLARGIDTAAHEGAVAAGGRTIAVIGSGLAQLYPPENQALAEKIADGHGAIVSEFPIDQPPDKQTFPMRNRIVSGWSSGLLVVEAPEWSGSLITANMASEQGRSVFAIPGPIDKPTSAGCNKLIQNGARLVMQAQDVLDEMSSLFPSEAGPAQPSAQTVALESLSAEEQTVYALVGTAETSMELILEQAGLTTPMVSASLMRLEMKKFIKQFPGRYYARM